jgi:hypothetical protein
MAESWKSLVARIFTRFFVLPHLIPSLSVWSELELPELYFLCFFSVLDFIPAGFELDGASPLDE